MISDTALNSQITEALTARGTWEERQRVFYEMRHQGLRRAQKPYPGAADLHFPLADTSIEKLKPFYFAQLYAGETFAMLVSKRSGQDAAQVTAAGQWFDYKLRSCSNFETEVLIGIDRMLNGGAGPLKTYWHPGKRQVRFAAPQVPRIIVPAHTEDVQEADWLVHVMQLSVAQYRGNPLYDQDKDLIRRIKGRGDGGDSQTGTGASTVQESQRREGISVGVNDNQIILWEIYVRDHAAGTWTVKTRAPVAFVEPIRPDFGLPYQHGRVPVTMFQAEVKEQGYYSSRGLVEILAPFETSLTKTWNGKHDCMDFYNRPLYTSEKDIPNVQNLQLRPGQILPFALNPVNHQRPPISFDEEMNNTRAVAEARISLPDFGVMGEQGGARTATEIRERAGQSSTVVDIRARVFRLALAEIYRQAWAILVQYDQEGLNYLAGNAQQTLDRAAMHTDYEVLPNGTDQSWNRPQQLQRAIQRKQLFAGSPWINQLELDRSILELDDPHLVKRLLVAPGLTEAEQTEDQAQEISVMVLGFPAPVRPEDNDVLHLQCLIGFVGRRMQTGEPITPELARLLLDHGGQHQQALAQKNPKAEKQMEAAAMPVIQFLAGLARADGGSVAGNPAPMGGGGAGGVSGVSPSAPTVSGPAPVNRVAAMNGVPAPTGALPFPLQRPGGPPAVNGIPT